MTELNRLYGIASGVSVNTLSQSNNNTQKVDPAVLKKIDEMDSVFSAFNRSVKVKVEGNTYIAEIYDKKTKKVVKTIPAEKVVEVRNRIHETISKFLETDDK